MRRISNSWRTTEASRSAGEFTVSMLYPCPLSSSRRASRTSCWSSAMRIRGCIISLSVEISSVALAKAGYALLPRFGRQSRSDILGAARLPVMVASNGFNVNGLYEIEEEGGATVWPLAGTHVPNSDTAREPRVHSEKKAPYGGAFLH